MKRLIIVVDCILIFPQEQATTCKFSTPPLPTAGCSCSLLPQVPGSGAQIDSSDVYDDSASIAKGDGEHRIVACNPKKSHMNTGRESRERSTRMSTESEDVCDNAYDDNCNETVIGALHSCANLQEYGGIGGNNIEGEDSKREVQSKPNYQLLPCQVKKQKQQINFSNKMTSCNDAIKNQHIVTNARGQQPGLSEEKVLDGLLVEIEELLDEAEVDYQSLLSLLQLEDIGDDLMNMTIEANEVTSDEEELENSILPLRQEKILLQLLEQGINSFNPLHECMSSYSSVCKNGLPNKTKLCSDKLIRDPLHLWKIDTVSKKLFHPRPFLKRCGTNRDGNRLTNYACEMSHGTHSAVNDSVRLLAETNTETVRSECLATETIKRLSIFVRRRIRFKQRKRRFANKTILKHNTRNVAFNLDYLEHNPCTRHITRSSHPQEDETSSVPLNHHLYSQNCCYYNELIPQENFYYRSLDFLVPRLHRRYRRYVKRTNVWRANCSVVCSHVPADGEFDKLGQSSMNDQANSFSNVSISEDKSCNKLINNVAFETANVASFPLVAVSADVNLENNKSAVWKYRIQWRLSQQHRREVECVWVNYMISLTGISAHHAARYLLRKTFSSLRRCRDFSKPISEFKLALTAMRAPSERLSINKEPYTAFLKSCRPQPYRRCIRSFSSYVEELVVSDSFVEKATSLWFSSRRPCNTEDYYMRSIHAHHAEGTQGSDLMRTHSKLEFKRKTIHNTAIAYEPFEPVWFSVTPLHVSLAARQQSSCSRSYLHTQDSFGASDIELSPSEAVFCFISLVVIFIRLSCAAFTVYGLFWKAL